jgi:hypothetical protein
VTEERFKDGRADSSYDSSWVKTPHVLRLFGTAQQAPEEAHLNTPDSEKHPSEANAPLHLAVFCGTSTGVP